MCSPAGRSDGRGNDRVGPLRSRVETEGDREKLARLHAFSDRQSSTRNCCRAGLAIRLHFVSRCYHSARNHSRLATRLGPAHRSRPSPRWLYPMPNLRVAPISFLGRHLISGLSELLALINSVGMSVLSTLVFQRYWDLVSVSRRGTGLVLPRAHVSYL